MKDNLNVHYDEEGDFLEIRIGKPTEAYFEDLGDDLFKRIDEKTREIRGFAIFNFKKRTEKLKDISVNLPVKIQLTS
ncbi:DUF2283 domain-containing protein [Candidatus Woesearchaeota archaeon]|nr:DUF2283 domain-containing protein [Candidatus Woesearchaeota archaeon]